jgi:hypothetical protein
MLGARTGITLAIAGVLALGPAACGGGGGGGDGDRGGGRDDAIRAAVVRAATAKTVAAKCEHSLTTDLIRRTYGSLKACRRVEAGSTDKPAEDVDVKDIRTTAGGGVHVRIEIHGGDNDGSEGGLSLAREAGEWRVSDFDADYLRSALRHGLLNQRDVPAFRNEAVRSCLIGALDRGDDAEFRRLAYGALGQRPQAMRGIFRVMAGCRVGGRSVLRLTFEDGITEQLRKDRRTKAQIACVIGGLRRNLSEAEVLAAVGADAGDRSKINAVSKKVGAALTACSR